MNRSANIHRKTNETEIHLYLNIDGKGESEIDTGIGFLDHMLHHVAVHGLFDLKLKADGDLHVDPHHTVEDIALTLGNAFEKALGEKKGIVRIAHAYVTMDESLALVALDLSGRPYSVIDVQWNGHTIGGIPVMLFEHFLESFAVTSRSNLHVRVLYGRDDHHKAESIFKALGRALDSATRLDNRRQNKVPSTKGTLLG
jgi:imidazoleglycerol-phosphate dehydratase